MYAEDLEHYHETMQEAIRKLKERNIPHGHWPISIRSQLASPTDVVNEEARNVADEEYEVDISDLNIAMREFLKLERRIKRKHQDEQQGKQTNKLEV